MSRASTRTCAKRAPALHERRAEARSTRGVSALPRSHHAGHARRDGRHQGGPGERAHLHLRRERHVDDDHLDDFHQHHASTHHHHHGCATHLHQHDARTHHDHAARDNHHHHPRDHHLHHPVHHHHHHHPDHL